MPTDNQMWIYFRMFIGVTLVGLFIYLVATDTEQTDLVSRLWLLIIGFLETGDSALKLRAARSKK